MESYGGVQSCIRGLERALRQDGCSVLTYALPSGDPSHKVHAGDSPRLPFAELSAALDNLLADNNIEAVLSHNLLGGHPQRCSIASVVARCAQLRRLPHVLVIHDIPPVDLRLPNSNEYRCDLSTPFKDARVAVTSEYNFQEFSRTFWEPDAIIPPGIDFRVYTPGGIPDRRTVAFPGRLTRYKGGLWAIRVVGELAKDIGPLRLLFSERNRGGHGESEEYLSEMEETASRYSQLSVEFITGPDAIPRIYQMSALTLALSEYEGFGMTPLESLVCHRPVVAMQAGGMTWLQGIPGALCIRYRLEAYEAVKQVMSDWEAWSAEAYRARELLAQTYDIRVVARQFLSMLRSGPRGSSDPGARRSPSF
jgi:glycosyltransferase involved in cell wall biosynthesis